MKHGSYQLVVVMMGVLLLAGCGGGNGSGPQAHTFGPLMARFSGNPQHPVTAAEEGSNVTSVAGAAFSDLVVSANNQDLIGPTGALGTTAGAFLYVTQGSSITCVAMIAAINPDEVRITQDLSGSSPTQLVFDVTAPHGMTLFNYLNGLATQTQTLIRLSPSYTPLPTSFQIVIDAATGTVYGVQMIRPLPSATP
jgi:hypothetical protein